MRKLFRFLGGKTDCISLRTAQMMLGRLIEIGDGQKEGFEKIMNELQALKDAVAALNKSFSAEVGAINTKLAAVAGQDTVQGSDLTPVTQSLTDLQATIDAETAALTAPASTGGAAAS